MLRFLMLDRAQHALIDQHGIFDWWHSFTTARCNERTVSNRLRQAAPESLASHVVDASVLCHDFEAVGAERRLRL